MPSTQSRIIQLLYRNNNTPLSIPMLAKIANTSLNDIERCIHRLKEDGFKMTKLTNGTYQVLSVPDKISENTLLWGLNTLTLGRDVVYRKKVKSTQNIAHHLAKSGAEHGTIVVADEQTEAKGQANKNWHSPQGSSIALSIIVRPKILPNSAPQFTLLTATAIADAIKSYVGITPSIKWPNDLLIHHKKIAGILTETQTEKNNIKYIVIGIGLNVNQTEAEIPTWLREKATSLKIETKNTWNRRKLIQKILQHFEILYQTYFQKGFMPIKVKWENYGYKLGELVHLGTSQQARFIGIAEDGALLMEHKSGEIQKIYSANVKWYNDINMS